MLANNVRLTIAQVRDSLAAMQGINSPNPLYEVLVRAVRDYMHHASNSRASNQTATEARARAEQMNRSAKPDFGTEAFADMMRKVQEEILKSTADPRFAGFDYGAGPDFTEYWHGNRTSSPPPPPRRSGPKAWWEVLGFTSQGAVTKHDGKAAYKRKAMEIHRKHDGDQAAMHDDMVELNSAKRTLEQVFGK